MLTGGPCGGKTTGQAQLATFFESLGKPFPDSIFLSWMIPFRMEGVQSSRDGDRSHVRGNLLWRAQRGTGQSEYNALSDCRQQRNIKVVNTTG